MKGSVKIVVSALVLTTLLVFGSNAYAQNKLKADVPFNYIANGTRYPAGTYTIDFGATSTVRITDANRASTFTFGSPAAEAMKSTTSKLVFHCYGNTCFLSTIWVAGSQRGMEFKVSKRERELQVEAERNAKSEVVMAAK